MEKSESQTTTLFVRVFAALLAGVISLAAVIGVIDFINGDDSNEVSWLYSQTSDSGELIQRGDGSYYLVMDGVDFHTIQFSDRPDRLVEVIDTADFVNQWDQLFASSSPNAVLIEHNPSGETDSLVVVLNKPHFDYARDMITYEAKILADELHPERLKKLANAHETAPEQMRAVSLFIDSVTYGSRPPSKPIFSGPFANDLKTKLGLSSIPTKNLKIADGLYLVSAKATANSEGTVTADAVVGFEANNSFQLQMSLSISDAQNWNLTATTAASTPWSPPQIPGLTIDPSSFTGSISKTNNVVAYNLTSASHNWQVASGATYSSNLSLSSDCPLGDTQCAGAPGGPYVSMNGTLQINGLPNVITLQGAMNTGGWWARFDGNAGDLTFNGTGVTNATLTIWRGIRNDSFDPNMSLPTLEKLTNGNNMEFCGGLTLTVPQLGNKATDGCVRWSPSGVVIGQVSVADAISGTMATASATVASATATAKGIVMTNIPEASLALLPSRNAIMSGVPAYIQDKKIVLAGTASLPGEVAKALNINLGSATKLSVKMNGEVSSKGFTMSGEIDVDINLGNEPFKLNVRKMTATVEKYSGSAASFSVGTSGDATVGYAPQTKTLQTSVSLVAGRATGMALSVNVTGTPSSTDKGVDGLTASTRLSDPANAQFVWNNQFGINGLKLWSLTVQVSYQDGSPALGYSSTSYMDPNGADTKSILKCIGPCDASDWMIGNLGFNVSYTNPCFAYQFLSTSGTSYLSLDGGVMTATQFAVGVAPTGCSIQTGYKQQSLSVGYVGFKFTGSVGDAKVNIATQLKDGAFVSAGSIDNMKLAGISYKSIKWNVSITTKEADFSFSANMVNAMGDMSVASEFSANSTEVSQSLDASLTDWKWGKEGTVDLKSFSFSTSANIPLESDGCASFSTSASGEILMGTQDIDLKDAMFAFDCNGVQLVKFDVMYKHTPKYGGKAVTAEFGFEYPTATGGCAKCLYAWADFSYNRSFSDTYKDVKFERTVKINLAMNVLINPKYPTSTAFTFSGKFEADRVSGDVTIEMDDDMGDFTASGELRLNPSNAGIYTAKWDNL